MQPACLTELGFGALPASELLCCRLSHMIYTGFMCSDAFLFWWGRLLKAPLSCLFGF